MSACSVAASHDGGPRAGSTLPDSSLDRATTTEELLDRLVSLAECRPLGSNTRQFQIAASTDNDCADLNHW